MLRRARVIRTASKNTVMTKTQDQEETFLGHPKGLFPLFFTEMWERLAFYTMLNVLLLYVTDAERGGLGLSAADGNEIYGLYLAFVYFTPFPGGMIADRFLGYRKAVVVGALLMSGGLFMMSIPGTKFFITGLVSLILGNGFFKPNISVMVGNLYPGGDPRRDSGFNIFYMGINIGAFAASFVSTWVRNGYGWLWTFRAAAIGLLVGLAILGIFWKRLEKADREPSKEDDGVSFGQVAVKILLPALGVGLSAFAIANALWPDARVRPADIGFLCGMIPVILFFVRLPNSGEPHEAPGLRALLPIYIAGGTFFMVLHLNGSAMTQWARDTTDREVAMVPDSLKQEAFPRYYTNAKEEAKRPAPESLLVVENETHAKMYGQQRLDTSAVASIAAASEGITVRELPLKQKIDELSAADAQIYRRSAVVYADGVVAVKEGTDSHGAPSVSVEIPDGAKGEKRVAFVREVSGTAFGTYVVSSELNESIYGGYEKLYGHAPEILPAGEFLKVINPELYQSFNALFVVLGTPLIVWFFGWMVRRKQEITAANKVFIGLLLTMAALVLMAIAGVFTEGNTVKVSGGWLIGFYGVITFGELCLSPIGLSLVTKLTPSRLVGLAMGGWFMATAFGNKFSGFFGGIQGEMSPPAFFSMLAVLALAAAIFIKVLVPKLDDAIRASQAKS
jgi:dipeptide/tripeptide permease